ncbi:MAG: hypothetical protein MZV49_12075 [Rhodopseudomonas palustris]|nr:hypothetical protein [Rhodopseudomonas palustris]
MECALVCPDAAIPNGVHDIHELLASAIKQLDIAPAAARRRSSADVRAPGPRRSARRIRAAKEPTGRSHDDRGAGG